MTESAPAEISVDLTILNEKGLHTRTSTLFVKAASAFTASLRVSMDQRTVDGRSVMELLSLGAGKGRTITLSVRGADGAELIRVLTELVESGFGEMDGNVASEHA